MDHDAALRARVLLLGTGRLDLLQEVTAYRALLPFSPAVHAPKLVRALAELSRDPQVRHLPEARLALLDEAVAAARGMAADDPRRPEVLVQALRSRQLHLYDLGRRAEGLAVREEMAALARAAVPGSPLARRGLEEWADALAEEGRHQEAAEAYGQAVRMRPGTGWESASSGTLIAWACRLEAAGRPGEAVAALEGVLALERAAAEHGPSACVAHVLLQLARMLDGAGRPGEADLAGREAADLLGALAADGGEWRRGRTGHTWRLMAALSGAPAEHAAADGPLPPFGSQGHTWSFDVRRRYAEQTEDLRTEADRLRPAAEADPAAHLGRLVALQRRLALRAAVLGDVPPYDRPGRPLPLPYFDEAVGLARTLHRTGLDRDGTALAAALTDRAGLLLSDGCFAAARADVEESLAHRPQAGQCSVGTPPPSTRATSVPVRPRPQRPVIPASRSASGGVLPRPTA